MQTTTFRTRHRQAPADPFRPGPADRPTRRPLLKAIEHLLESARAHAGHHRQFLLDQLRANCGPDGPNEPPLTAVVHVRLLSFCGGGDDAIAALRFRRAAFAFVDPCAMRSDILLGHAFHTSDPQLRAARIEEAIRQGRLARGSGDPEPFVRACVVKALGCREAREWQAADAILMEAREAVRGTRHAALIPMVEWAASGCLGEENARRVDGALDRWSPNGPQAGQSFHIDLAATALTGRDMAFVEALARFMDPEPFRLYFFELCRLLDAPELAFASAPVAQLCRDLATLLRPGKDEARQILEGVEAPASSPVWAIAAGHVPFDVAAENLWVQVERRGEALRGAALAAMLDPGSVMAATLQQLALALHAGGLVEDQVDRAIGMAGMRPELAPHLLKGWLVKAACAGQESDAAESISLAESTLELPGHPTEAMAPHMLAWARTRDPESAGADVVDDVLARWAADPAFRQQWNLGPTLVAGAFMRRDSAVVRALQCAMEQEPAPAAHAAAIELLLSPLLPFASLALQHLCAQILGSAAPPGYGSGVCSNWPPVR